MVAVPEYEPQAEKIQLSQLRQTLRGTTHTRRFWVIAGVLAVVVIIAVMTQLPESSAISAVRKNITAVSSSGRTYLTGSLKRGTAVLVDHLAAYWVKNSQVYAANGFAKTWSPGISYSTDPDISFDSVEQAVK